MIYEMRIYHVVPGRMPDLLARFNDHTLRIWERFAIHQVGFWTTLVGASSSELTYILAWDSLADREAKWNAFQSDPEWLRIKAETEKAGAINATISNQFLTPTAFSALR